MVLKARIREPAVAGSFYPSDSKELETTVNRLLFLGEMELKNLNLFCNQLSAIIAPHAGYVYSGLVAGCAFSLLRKFQVNPDKVILIGPAHYVPVNGAALPVSDYFQTPLGLIEVSQSLREEALKFPFAVLSEEAHQPEHCLEVELPFLQKVAGESFSILPILTGTVSYKQVAEMLQALINSRNETVFVVVSSDLSHYLSYDEAVTADQETASFIVDYQPDLISSDRACGSTAIKALLEVFKGKGYTAEVVKLANSGDACGDMDKVVGYGSFVFGEGAAAF